MSEAGWACPSCGFAEAGTSLHCRRCGEQRPGATPATGWVALRRWGSTLTILVLQPGRLTADNRDGRRRPWVPPLSLFFAINVVFFIGQALSGLNVLAIPLQAHLEGQPYAAFANRLVDARLAATRSDRVAFSLRFDLEEQTLAKATVLAMVPPLALCCALLFLRQQQRPATHLVFALHFYAFLLLFVTVFFCLLAAVLRGWPALRVGWPPGTLDGVATGAEAGAVVLYLFFATARVYGSSWLWRLLSAGLLLVAVAVVLYLHRFAVFVLTAWLV